MNNNRKIMNTQNTQNTQKYSYNTHQRSNDFRMKYYSFHNEIYKDYKKVEIDELEYDDKLSKESKIMDYLYNMMLDKGSVNFVSSQTNSGKTYCINEIFKKLNKVEKKLTKEEVLYKLRYQDDPELAYELIKDTIPTYLNVLTMPSNPQTIQVGKSYGMQILVGEDGYRDIDFTKDGINVSMVYDMSKVLIDLLENNEYLIVNLVIDEAHELTSSQFRIETIDQLEKLKELVLRNGGTVTYLTATYAEMVYLQGLKHILFCNKRQHKINTEKVKLIYVNTDKQIEDVAINHLKDKKGLVRFNRKDGQKDIQTELSLLNKKVYYVNSDEKQSYTNKVTKEKTYKNKMMNDIVNNEILPSDSDLSICTQLLDSGSNIVGVGDKNNKPKDFNTFHFIRDSRDLNLSQIEQFFNRIRFDHESHEIILKKQQKTDNEKVYDFDLRKTFKFCYFKLQRQVKYLEKEIEDLREIKFKGEKDIDKLVEKTIKDTLAASNNFDGLENSMGGCIRYIDGKITVDYKFFLNYCLNKVNQSLYYNEDKFIDELGKIFNKEIEVIEINDDELDLEIDKTKIDDYKKILLDQLRKNAPLFPGITKTQFYKEACRVHKITNKNIQESLEIVLTMNDKELQELYNTYSKNTMVKLNKTEMKQLMEILNNEKQLKDLKSETTQEELYKITSNKQFRDKLNTTLRKGSTIDEFIIHYCKSSDEKELKKFIKDKRIVENNNNYLDGYKNLLMAHAEHDQLIILEYIKNIKNYKLYNKNPNGQDGKLDNLDKIIQELYDKTGHKYTRRQLINFIKKIYTYREEEQKVKGQKVTATILNSIRTKI